MLDEWHQCFAIFINDGQENPFEYYKNVLHNFKDQLKISCNNLTPIFCVEGGLLIQNDLTRIEQMHTDGIRALTLTWNGENQIAGGANTDVGLKSFGKDVINELNNFDIMVDLSHLNKKSFYSALELSKTPIITHSALECVCNHRRNIDFFQLDALVRKGGIFGLCFYPEFLGNNDVFEDIYKNIFYVLDKGYENFLSIGSDFDGAVMSEKLYDISCVNALYQYLKNKNISKDVLDKIFFYNAYNFFNKGKI